MAMIASCANLFTRATVSCFPAQLTQRLHCAATSKTVNLLRCCSYLKPPSVSFRNASSFYFTESALIRNRPKSSCKFHEVIMSVHPDCVFNKGAFRTLFTGPVYLSRLGGSRGSSQASKNRNGVIYIIAVFIFMIGTSYAAVPLYKVFCQATGLGGQPIKGHDISLVETMTKVDRKIKVKFNADVNSSMQWNFKPQQTEVNVALGETALAFYTAKNPTTVPIIGISTYNVIPYDAALYFNKIQCFCFEEQRLNPGEQVDMPVFFYLDPEFGLDPKLEDVDIITLSYTFFEAKEGLQLPLPGYPQPHDPKPIPM